jgi:hypothetical protein
MTVHPAVMVSNKVVTKKTATRLEQMAALKTEGNALCAQQNVQGGTRFVRKHVFLS